MMIHVKHSALNSGLKLTRTLTLIILIEAFLVLELLELLTVSMNLSDTGTISHHRWWFDQLMIAEFYISARITGSCKETGRLDAGWQWRSQPDHSGQARWTLPGWRNNSSILQMRLHIKDEANNETMKRTLIWNDNVHLRHKILDITLRWVKSKITTAICKGAAVTATN